MITKLARLEFELFYEFIKIEFCAFSGKKKYEHTTKHTKGTKDIYFILLFLGDLRGKNKTDFVGFGLLRADVSLKLFPEEYYILAGSP
jgi:hypothetical protein